MKKINLSLFVLVLLFFCLISKGQTIDLEYLKELRTISLIDMHDAMLNKGFSLKYIDKNKTNRVDSIVYSNENNFKIIYQFKSKSEQNAISLLHQDNEAYKAYNQLLKGKDYVMLNSEIISNKGIQNFFYCKKTQLVIVVILAYDSVKVENKAQGQSYIYHVLSAANSKNIIRRYKSKLI